MPDTRAHPAVLCRRILPVTALLLAAATLLCLAAAGCGSTTSPPEPSVTGTAPPQVRAWTGILIERGSGRVLWSKSPDRELPPASTAKIMTALLTLERVRDLDEWATVPRIPLPQEVGVDLVPGDRITVREALYALLLESANDAALTLAAHVAGSESRFVVLMNRRARQLGLTHTHFTNSRGTAQLGFHSSARDLATLARHALRKATFRHIVSTRDYVVRYPPHAAIPVHNHNRLLQEYAWADGVKTGSNDASGKVLVGSGKPGALALIVVTMHQRTRPEEVEDAVKLFNWGTAEYLRRTAVPASHSGSATP
jgi:serine-type D-Ala-D-Ala carboxypeptidase (penicillin-binding protein 5/6)